jgi:hypothetical protein
MYDYSRVEPRQHFQEQIIDVTAYLHGVRGVDEQDIARVQLREEFQIDLLHGSLNQRL